MKPKRNDPNGEGEQLIPLVNGNKSPQGLPNSAERPPPAKLTTWLAPTPLKPPQVDPEITHLNSVERSVEVLRYFLRRAEYWLSPEGLLREWVRRILRLAMAIAIPTLILAPLITLLLTRLQIWSVSALEIAQTISKIPAQLSSGLCFVGVAYLLFRWLIR